MQGASLVYSVEKMSELYGVSRSSYYWWCNRKPSSTAIINNALTKRIKAINAQSQQTYGSPRIADQLRDEGHSVSRPRVARLMRKAGIKAIQPKRFVVTTDSAHQYHPAPNLLNRSFSPTKLGQAWVSDLTYVPTREGWVFLTTIMDLADRQIIGWPPPRQ